MKSYKTKAFIVRSYPFGESHKIIHLFSREQGKCQIVVYGLRKIKNKYGSIFELLNEVFIILLPSKSKNLFYVKDVDLINSNHLLRENFDLIKYIYYLADFISSLTLEGLSDVKMYFLLQETIKKILEYPKSIYELLRSFELKTLKELGFLSNLIHCSFSNEKLDNYLEKISLSNINGWIHKSKYKINSDSREISIGTHKILLSLLNYKIDQIVRLKIGLKIKEELNLTFKYLIKSILGRNLKSSNYLTSF